MAKMNAGRVAPIKFKTDSPDVFEETMAVVAGPVNARPAVHSPFNVEVNLAKLPRIGLFTIRSSEFRVNSDEPLGFTSCTVPLSGHFTIADSHGEAFGPGTAYVASSDRLLDLQTTEDSRVLVANFDRTLLSAYRTKLNGGEVSGELDFRPRISLTTPEGASFWRYLSFVWGEVSRGSTLLRSLVIASEIEDSLMAMFLYASSSDFPDRAPSKVTSINRAYLNRAEDYMLAHLSDPLSLADIAEVAGVSARTLSRAFKKRYGMGPMTFRKERRLEAAQRALLAASHEAATVTKIATGLGFYHLGQFSADYHKAFQELPSETLHR